MVGLSRWECGVDGMRGQLGGGGKGGGLGGMHGKVVVLVDFASPR